MDASLPLYHTLKQDAIAQYRQHLRPDFLLVALSAAADRCITSLLHQAPLPKHSSVIAVGGYGRNELYPESDVDILILLASEPNRHETTQIQAFVAGLWDQGLKASHTVCTIKQSLDEAVRNIATQTALLDARLVSGELELFTSFQHAYRKSLDPQRFFLAKRSEMQQRHQRYHGTAYALEPNCKESPGALRDLQLLLWLSNAAGLGASWSDVANSNLLSTAERRAIQRCSIAFIRLRVELHLLTERAEDRLLFDLQPKLAKLYGYTNETHRLGSEILMQRYYWAARTVSQLNLIFMQELEEQLFPGSDTPPIPIDSNFTIINNRLELVNNLDLTTNPSLIFQTFLHYQSFPQLQGMSANTLRSIWHSRRLIDSSFRDNEENKRLFIQIFQAPRGVVHTLRLMTLLNILPRYLPAFRRIVGQMQHDLFHVYTVEQHTLMVIRNLRRFTMPEHAHEHVLASQLAPNFKQYWLLYIAALFHDIGKGRGGNHSEIGAQEALEFCRSHNLSADETELVVYLVRDHLRLSLVAQKQDISNPVVVSAFAEHANSMRKLNALYLLTVADIKGTNPAIWNAWKAKLLDDLFLATKRALGSTDFQTSTVLERRKHVANSSLLAQGAPREAIERFWHHLGENYFLRHDSDDIIWHTSKLYDIAEQKQATVASRLLEDQCTLQVLVYIQDRTDLFMQICHYFDRHDISIQDARVYTTSNGWALDTFVVTLPPALAHMQQLGNKLKHDFEHWLNMPATKRQYKPRHYLQRRSARAKTFPITPVFHLSPPGKDGAWHLNLVTSDRKGLLYSLAKIFAHYQLNIQSAKIMTLGERIEDHFTFYSEQLLDEQALQEFEQAIVAVLS